MTAGAVIAAPFGSWASPFKLERLTDRVVFVTEPFAVDGVTWWLEGRPDEAGRQVLVRREADGTITRITPEGFNARSRVHEYGGAASMISGDLIVVSDFVTGRLNRVARPGELVPITPPDRQWRYTDVVHDRARTRLLAVREDHEPDTVATHGEWANDLVAIDLESGEVTILATGADFYAAPRLSPDGTTLAWIEWDHPNLPWDGTELRLAGIGADGTLVDPHTVVGSAREWVSQPRWSPEGVLHFAAELGEWINLYRYVDGAVEQLTHLEAELAPPDWLFGYVHYGWLRDGDMLAVARSDGRDRLIRVTPRGDVTPIDLPYTEIGAVSIDGERIVLRAAGPAHPASIVEVRLDGSTTVLRQATPFEPELEDVSIPRHIEFPTTGGRTSHGNFYAPTNRRFVGVPGELPPLIVTSHGGPTSSAFSGFATGVQLFASRGYAVLDVDYGGSTGYGREYRKRLEGQWGIVDVDDCVAGAKYLAEQGLVDGKRQAIRGGSASGFTTLAALAFTKQFDAGTTYFGIGDLRAFVKDTHKFESRYLESLVGPWPDAKQLYLDRSPALHAEQITAPVLVQQGAEDKVVPKEEGERIVDALFERRVPHAYIVFEGEDHGFRSEAAIIRSFGAELSFYAQVFGFEPADDIEQLEIQFLAESRERIEASRRS